jgi:hypothetical protein
MFDPETNTTAAGRLADRVRDNAQGFLGAHRWWLALFVLAAAADGASTIWFMRHEGADAELHPAIRLIARITGPVVGPVLGKLGQLIAGLGLAVFFRRQAALIFLVASVLYLWAAWYNTWGHQYYTPRLLHWFG